MTGRMLEQAARQLRDATARAAEVETGESTLAAVVTHVRRKARRRRVLTIVGLQVGLATFGVGAWAAASGRLEVLLASIRPAHVASQTTDAPTPAKTRRRRPPVPPAPESAFEIAPSPSSAAEPVEPPAPAAPAAGRKTVAVAMPPAPPPAALPSLSPPEVPAADQDALYRQAHQAHFIRRDFAAALSAWDRYLALPRPGRLVLEARYNRAIALFRLGRRSQAAEALTPFAHGDYGPYRQAEARALLDELSAATTP